MYAMYNKMSNKRMKRLLGNGFYLNVKFDQSAIKTNRGRSSFKRGYEKIQDFELFDIKEGEVLYGVNKVNNKKPRNRNGSTHASHVLSSLNGALDADDPDLDLYTRFSFQGIAQTEHNAKEMPQIDQGLVSCVSGVITILNNYSKEILPGDILYLHEPCTKNKNRGIPRDKKCFCLANLNHDDIAEYYLKLIQAKADAGEEELKKLVTELATFSHIDHRQVAKAMSRAKPGQKLDILLYPRLSSVA